jgi:phosphomannomutase
MPATAEKLYLCPGAVHPVSRPVHLARLATGDPTCRTCPLRTDTGTIPPRVVRRIEQAALRVPRASLCTDEGIRGVHLNELDRPRAAAIVARFARRLWEEMPPCGTLAPARRAGPGPQPVVVVGHDERPSSPDLVAAVLQSLRTMGCQVVDVRQTTAPAWRFAVAHLQAAGGVFVTGWGTGPAWTGLDFAVRGGCPVSRREAERSGTALSLPGSEPAADTLSLDDFADDDGTRTGRTARRAGPYRSFDATVPYAAGLRRHFHALRPLRVVLATPSDTLVGLASRLFDPLPCTLLTEPLPERPRDPHAPDDPDVRRLAESVARRNAHLGCLIDEAGSRLAVCDETGRIVPPSVVLRMLADVLRTDHPGRSVVCLEPGTESDIAPAGTTTVAVGARSASLWRALRASDALIGGGTSGRYWFPDAVPACDAILALAGLLSALSRTDAPCSTVVAASRAT